MALTVRMDAKTERTLDRIAKRRNLSRSDVVREAVAHYGTLHEQPPAASPYDAWADVVGVVDLGIRDASRTTGEQFADALKSRKGRRAR